MKARASRRDTKSRQTLSTRKALAKGRTPTYHDGLREGIESALDYRDHVEALRRGRPMVWEDINMPVNLPGQILAAMNQYALERDLRRTSMYGSLERGTAYQGYEKPFLPEPKPKSFLSRIMWWRA